MTDVDHGRVLARWWRSVVVGNVDHQAVLDRVTAEARWSGRYAFLIVISVGISILGLLLPSSAVLIGAMLISPLMMPIIGLGFGLATFDWVEIRRAGTALLLGAVIAVALSAAFVAVSPVQTVTSEIAIRTRPNLFDLLVALLSAVAGGYALIRGQGGTVVGVAIAIALMPPLAVVGFGVATANMTIAAGAGLLFLTNLVTIALTAAFVARLYGFGAHLSPAQTRMQGTLIVLGLAALAVPLAIALKQIAWEAVAQRQARDAVVESFPDTARLTEFEVDFDRRPVRVRAVAVTPKLVARADAVIGQAVTAALKRPVDAHVDQLLVGQESGASEAAQLAAAQPAAAKLPGRDGANVAEALALAAGVPADGVLVDAAKRRAWVRAAVLPGATAATYRALEQRVAGGNEGWQVLLVPPATPLGRVPFEEDAPDAGFLADAAWAAQRRDEAITVTGRGERADAVARTLADAGARVDRATGPATRVVLGWSVPAE